MTVTAATIARSVPRDNQAAWDHARIDIPRFFLLALQLAMSWWVIRVFNVEGPAFQKMAGGVTAAFVIHYFTPFRFKKHAFIALSLAVGAYALYPVDPRINALNATINVASIIGAVCALAVLCFLVLRLRIGYWKRVGMLVGLGIVLWILRDQGLVYPNVYWAIIGSIFMFRLSLFAYEVRSARHPESFVDFMSYMLLPPNFYFALFPVVDYSTFKRSFFAQDIHVVAQRGIHWILRGVVQLLLLNIVRHELQISAGQVYDLPTLLKFVFSAYLMYLRVSGHFHIIVGMLLLFGYNLPETHKRYFLAHSFMDFWRRINIYWKDYMVKMVFYPVYFRLRKRNETAAMVVGTACVFAATTVLHSYQFFWINGEFDLTVPDVLFWSVLGVMVIINILLERRAGPTKAARGQRGAWFWTRRVAQIIGMYLFMSVLWSMWSSRELGLWLDTVAIGLGVSP